VIDLAALVEGAVKAGFVLALWVAALVPMLVWGERKVSAWIQGRTGPNRVGPWGLIQPVADVIKFFFKEDVTPAGAHKVLFFLAPVLEVFTASIAMATIPFGDRIVLFDREIKLVVADLDIGLLWIFAVGSLSVYGILLAGWSSANHYSFLGGLRSSAQIISYELGMTLSVVGVLLFAGSLRLRAVIESQSGGLWNCWVQPIGFVVFLVSIFAETNRNPFDLPEAESELVAGYHTEYSAMRFAMFFMAEYVNMITMSALLVALYLGGWHFPGLSLLEGVGPGFLFVGPGWAHGVASFAVFMAKTCAVLFLFLWTRWTLPRFRYDQLMALGWKGTLPLAMLQVFAAAVKEVFGWGAYAALTAAILLGFVAFLRSPRTIRRDDRLAPAAAGPAIGGRP
jgi:NADH-quinone oxidoreductase subunit H